MTLLQSINATHPVALNDVTITPVHVPSFILQLLLPELDACYLPSAGKSRTHSPRLSQHHWQQQQQQQYGGQRSSHVTRITGTRQEYDKDGIIDPEEIWGEDADNEFIEVGSAP
jgi:hypothetical protein